MLLIIGSSGWIIFSTELCNSSKPTNMINISTNSAVIYSILPCPHGWSASTFFCDILKPIIVTTDEPASETLFKPSDIIDIEFDITPIITLKIDKSTFTIIPVILESIAYFPLTFWFSTLSLSLINSLINKLVIFSFFLLYFHLYHNKSNYITYILKSQMINSNSK